MSPELLDPDRFGFEDTRPSNESDCYALGVVIYSVLSGRVPFAQSKNPAVVFKLRVSGQEDQGVRRGSQMTCVRHWNCAGRLNREAALPFRLYLSV